MRVTHAILCMAVIEGRASPDLSTARNGSEKVTKRLTTLSEPMRIVCGLSVLQNLWDAKAVAVCASYCEVVRLNTLRYSVRNFWKVLKHETSENARPSPPKTKLGTGLEVYLREFNE